LIKSAEALRRGQDLVVAAGLEDGILMLKDFELMKLPGGRWRRMAG